MANHLGVGGHDRVQEGCLSNLQKMYLALNIYQNDNKGSFPNVPDASSPSVPLSLLVPKSTTVTELFICPGSQNKPLPEGEPFASRKISYAYYMGRTVNDDPGEILVTDAQVNRDPKKAGEPLFSANGEPPGNNHGKAGGNLLSRGGEVSTSGPKASRSLLITTNVRLLNP